MEKGLFIHDLSQFFEVVNFNGTARTVTGYGKIKEVKWKVENILIDYVVITQIAFVSDYLSGGEGQSFERKFTRDAVPEAFRLLISSQF